MRRGFLSCCSPDHCTRRAALASAGAFTALQLGPQTARGLGTINDISVPRVTTHAVVNTGDMDAMLQFLLLGLNMEVLDTTMDGTVNTTFVGFGPRQLTVPPQFIPGVSSWEEYGGHFSLKLVSDTSERTKERVQVFEPGNGLEYIKLGVPRYRISKLIEYGGTLESSYGFTMVRAPGGLQFQVVLGDQVIDPMMFAALNVKDIKAAEAFYTQLGMRRLPSPHARAALDSPFEPNPPKGSVYLSYAPDTFGVLLLPQPKTFFKSPPKIEVGSVFGGLAILTDDVQSGADQIIKRPGPPTSGESAGPRKLIGSDPDGFGIELIEYSDFAKDMLHV